MSFVIGSIRPALLLFIAMVVPAGAAAAIDPERWLGETEAAFEGITSYTAVVHKQQRIAGRLLPEETIFLKCRKRPFSLYLKWLRPPHEGSELLYSEGWNDNRVRAHRGGIFRFVVRNVAPRDPVLMKNNLRPVTSIGIGYLLRTVAEDIRKAVKAGKLTFSQRGEETLYGRNTRILEVIFPMSSKMDFDGRRYVINQDFESKVLIRIEVYDRHDQLIEKYAYENLHLNARLSDADFDPKNPEYHF